jgi:ureidoglycolate hydrolase
MISMKVIKADSLNFSRYGSVVSTPEGSPTSEGSDYRFWSDIGNYNIKGDTEVGICTVYKTEHTAINTIERHLNTPEILIPIDAPFILPVYSGDKDEPMEYFQVNIGEAIIINEAVWHGPCLPVGKEESSYFVIFRRKTPFEDVEKKQLN